MIFIQIFVWLTKIFFVWEREQERILGRLRYFPLKLLYSRLSFCFERERIRKKREKKVRNEREIVEYYLYAWLLFCKEREKESEEIDKKKVLKREFARKRYRK